MQISVEDLHKSMRERTDDELRAILSVRASDYTPQAITAAREEFDARGLSQAPAEIGAANLARAHKSLQLGGGLLLLVLIFAGAVLLYYAVQGVHAGYASIRAGLDAQGLLSHERETPVWFKGDWLTGEVRVCEMPGSDVHPLPSGAHLLCPQGGYDSFIQDLSDMERVAFLELNWKMLDHRFHVIPVTYWGRIDRNEPHGANSYSWRCVRREDWNHNISLKCFAMN